MEKCVERLKILIDLGSKPRQIPEEAEYYLIIGSVFFLNLLQLKSRKSKFYEAFFAGPAQAKILLCSFPF